eukprot:bmy_19881T0
MGIPSFLALPAARSDRADCTSCHPLGHMLLWTALLFLGETGSPGGAVEQGQRQACFSNSAAVTSVGAELWARMRAGAGSTSDWLLLQTPSLVFQEGEPIVLRCHSWKNSPLNKVVFFQNGKSKTFSYLRSNFSIPQANLSHSGEYHCTGFIGRTLYSSQPVTITVQGPAILFIIPPWYQITFCLVMGLLFAVDTELYFSVQRDLQSSVGDWKNCKVRWSQGPQDK